MPACHRAITFPSIYGSPRRLLRCPLMRLFRNPHHLSGVVFAMLMTNAATLIWAGIVLAKTNTLLDSGSRYAFVTAYIHENVLAALIGTDRAA